MEMASWVQSQVISHTRTEAGKLLLTVFTVGKKGCENESSGNTMLPKHERRCLHKDTYWQ